MKMRTLLFGALLFVLQVASAGDLPSISVMTTRTNALYRCGERAEFAVAVGEGDVCELSLRAILSNDGRDVFSTNVLNLSSGERRFVVAGTMTKPGFLRLQVEAERGAKKVRIDACAAFEPEKILAAMEKPADFDEFWAESFRELQSIPPDFQLTPMERSPKGIETYAISAATVNGKRIWGFISIPTDKSAKYPINVTLPSAGDGVNQPVYGKGRSIELVAIVHDNPVGVSDAAFKENHRKVMAKACGSSDRSKCLDGCKSGFYPWFGAEDRKLYYFRPVFLGISRLLDYALSRPEWNGKDVNVSGHSQGGGLSLILTALRQDVVTSTCAAAPGFCDHAGHDVGRETGWPWLIGAVAGDSRTDAGVAARRQKLNRELTGYYDACFFCDRIKTPIAVAVGFTDCICVPSSVFAAYNRIPSAHKRIVHDVTHGHAVSDAANAEARQWLQRELAAASEKKVGIIGIDTWHALEFTKLLNAVDRKPAFDGFRVTHSYEWGSRDIASSLKEKENYRPQLLKLGVKPVDSIAALLKEVDCVLLETNDGRPHLAQAKEVFASGKPVFIDKPLAATWADCKAIDTEARRVGAKWYSSSGLRYQKALRSAKAGEYGKVFAAQMLTPAWTEPTQHPYYWYGIHGAEPLYAAMGAGCETVRCVGGKDDDILIGTWKDGCIGQMRASRSEWGAGAALHNGQIVTQKKGALATGDYEGYEGLLESICTFFRTGVPPVPNAETLEIYAFMEAGLRSKALGGAPVKIADVLKD